MPAKITKTLDQLHSEVPSLLQGLEPDLAGRLKAHFDAIFQTALRDIEREDITKIEPILPETPFADDPIWQTFHSKEYRARVALRSLLPEILYKTKTAGRIPEGAALGFVSIVAAAFGVSSKTLILETLRYVEYKHPDLRSGDLS